MRQGWKATIFTLVMAVLFTVRGASAASPTSQSVVVLPYVAVGGVEAGWHFITVFVLRNPHEVPHTVTAEFFDNGGHPLLVGLDGGSEFSEQATWTIPGRESRLLILSHPSEVFQAGWVRLNLPSESAVEVTAVVQFYNGKSLIGEAGTQVTAPQTKTKNCPYYLAGFGPAPQQDLRRLWNRRPPQAHTPLAGQSVRAL